MFKIFSDFNQEDSIHQGLLLRSQYKLSEETQRFSD